MIIDQNNRGQLCGQVVIMDGEAPPLMTEGAGERWGRWCCAANPIGRGTVLVRCTRRLPGTDGITGDGGVVTSF